MNTNVDVLAVLDALIEGQTGAWGIPEQPLVDARAAVAELIEADKEYDKAYAEWNALAPFSIGEADGRTVTQFQPLQFAMARRYAALARVGGAS